MTIGWIGTGVMGRSMVLRLIAGGHGVAVHNRTRARAEDLLHRGARWADSPRALLAECETIVTMLGYPRDVEEVYLGAQGLLTSAPGVCRLLIDMTTSSPTLAARISEAAKARGISALDAPVSGGDIGAREGTLSIMVGGTAEALERATPIFEKLGKKFVLQGGPGAGQHTKMVNQILIATNMIGVCEGLIYAERAGLDPLRVIESVGSGAAGSWSVNNLAPRMLRGDFEPGFYVEHFLKDMEIALAEAKRMQLELPGLKLAFELYERVRAAGNGRKGTQALLLAIRAMNAR